MDLYGIGGYLQNEYPRLFNNNYPDIVACATKFNVEHATDAFFRTSHSSLYLSFVGPYKRKEHPYCRWFVEYTPLDGSDLPIDEDELKILFDKIIAIKPRNVIVVGGGVKNSKVMVVQYGVTVGCPCLCPDVIEKSIGPLAEWDEIETQIDSISVKMEIKQENPFC